MIYRGLDTAEEEIVMRVEMLDVSFPRGGRPTRRVVVNGKEMSLRAWDIYQILKSSPSVSAPEIAHRLRLTKGRVYQCIRELEEAGLVERRRRFSVSG